MEEGVRGRTANELPVTSPSRQLSSPGVDGDDCEVVAADLQLRAHFSS